MPHNFNFGVKNKISELTHTELAIVKSKPKEKGELF